MILQVIKWIGGCDYLVSLGVSTIVEIGPDKCNIEKNIEVFVLLYECAEKIVLLHVLRSSL